MQLSGGIAHRTTPGDKINKNPTPKSKSQATGSVSYTSG